MAAIFYASSLPAPPIPEGTDKQFHLSGYFFFAIVVIRAVAGGLPRRFGLRTAMVAVAIAAGYGATDEFHQMFVPGRSADVYDWLADAIGVLLATIGCFAWGLTQTEVTRHKSQGSSYEL